MTTDAAPDEFMAWLRQQGQRDPPDAVSWLAAAVEAEESRTGPLLTLAALQARFGEQRRKGKVIIGYAETALVTALAAFEAGKTKPPASKGTNGVIIGDPYRLRRPFRPGPAVVVKLGAPRAVPVTPAEPFRKRGETT